MGRRESWEWTVRPSLSGDQLKPPVKSQNIPPVRAESTQAEIASPFRRDDPSVQLCHDNILHSDMIESLGRIRVTTRLVLREKVDPIGIGLVGAIASAKREVPLSTASVPMFPAPSVNLTIHTPNIKITPLSILRRVRLSKISFSPPHFQIDPPHRQSHYTDQKPSTPPHPLLKDRYRFSPGDPLLL